MRESAREMYLKYTRIQTGSDLQKKKKKKILGP
jgi:hypothetical protein